MIWDKKINDKRLALHHFVCFSFTTHTYRVYYEQPRIVHQRHKYLRRMRRNRTERKPVVYLDSKPSGKGERLIILYAGGEDEWVPGNFL